MLNTEEKSHFTEEY